MKFRIPFLKVTLLIFCALILVVSAKNPTAKEPNYKDVTDKIPEAKQEDFMDANWYGWINFGGDSEPESFQTYIENDSTLVKFFPINDGDVPCVINFDTYDRGFGNVTEPLIDVKNVVARQTGNKTIKFKMSLFESPLDLSEDDKEVILDKEHPLKYIWRIDTDRDKKTGEEGEYIGADYHLKLQGNTKEWEASLEDMINNEELPVENYNVIGNEIEATISLEDLGNPESFDFAAWTRSPETEGPNRYEDRSPEFVEDGKNFFGVPMPDKEEFSPGIFKVDPDYKGGGREEIMKIYRLPSKVKDVETSDEVPTTLTVTTEDSEYLFDYHKGDIRIREKT